MVKIQAIVEGGQGLNDDACTGSRRAACRRAVRRVGRAVLSGDVLLSRLDICRILGLIARRVVAGTFELRELGLDLRAGHRALLWANANVGVAKAEATMIAGKSVWNMIFVLVETGVMRVALSCSSLSEESLRAS